MNCRLCHSQKTKLLLVAGNTHGRHSLGKERFKLYECQDCRTVFTDVRVSDSYYRRYYPAGYYADYRGNFLIENLLKFLRWVSCQRRLGLIEKYRPKAKKILEVGCGTGDFLAQLPTYFERYGTEINPEACREIRKTHPEIRIFDQKIDEKGLGKKIKFDVVLMWHVLEHIEDPCSFFKGIFKLLEEKGVLIFDIPNRRSLGFTLTKGSWFHLDAPRHLFYYEYDCLRPLLKEHHFRVKAFLGNPVDYGQDLAASLWGRNRQLRRKSFLWKIIDIATFPLWVLVRLWLSLCWPNRAEVNTYVVQKTGKSNV
jgi:SAM-dependent methyltransferase